MGRLTFDDIRKLVNHKEHIKNYYKQYEFNVFVETGTHIGSTIFAVAPFFKEAHTIELSAQFFEHCKNMAAANNITNIKFYNGSSDKLIKTLCTEINVPTIFFLDSHWSKENTARGEVDVPLLTELKYIKDRNMPDIVIIDDHRLFGTGGGSEVDWSCITEKAVNTALEGHIFDIVATDDRYVVFLKTASS
jgi:hypothetical protein